MHGYTQMMNESRDLATKRMIEEADSLEADAIVSIRYVTASIAAGSAEVLAFGTALKFK